METNGTGLSRETLQAVGDEVRRVLREELGEAGLAPIGRSELAARWDGGEMILKPGREGLQEKVIPLESFFHKIVMARERLRVLEQKLNNHPTLSDAERIELQAYITRIYGSFTTFNVLFDDRADWFTGTGGER